MCVNTKAFVEVAGVGFWVHVSTPIKCMVVIMFFNLLKEFEYPPTFTIFSFKCVVPLRIYQWFVLNDRVQLVRDSEVLV